MGDGFDNWTVQLRKGILEFCVLSSIAVEEEAYGYELVKKLVNAPGLDASERSIYPLLSRMRRVKRAPPANIIGSRTQARRARWRCNPTTMVSPMR